MQNLCTCLWFDDRAEQAAKFYVSVFPNSKILDIKYYLEGMPKPAGSVLTVSFSLDGVEYLALNGGPHYQFSPATSLVAYCDTQQQVDTLWEKLSAGGKLSRCGWLDDQFGVTWQIVPRKMIEFLNTDDKAASQRAMNAMMQMVKLDIAALQRAYDGK